MEIPHFRPGTDDDRWVIPELVHEDMYRVAALARTLDGAGGTILDCGAHIGVFALLLARHGVRQPIEAFEPEPGNYALLVKNAAAYSTITPRAVAVGVRDEERKLYDCGETGRWSFTPPRADPGGRGVSVRVIDLYRHIRELGRVALLKLDLEGYEAEVLNGMPADVLARVDLLLTEEHHLPIDHARLADAGFELWFRPGQDPRQRVYRLVRGRAWAMNPEAPPAAPPGRPRHHAVVQRGTAGEAEGLVGRPWGIASPAEARLMPADAGRVLDLSGEPGAPCGPGEVVGVVVGDPEADGFSPGPEGFDVVVCGRLLEQVRDADRLLRRVREWLRPGGCMVARLANARHYAVLQGLLYGAWEGGGGAGGPARIRFFTRREIEKSFYRAGFALEALRGVPVPPVAPRNGQGREREIDLGRLYVRGLSHSAAEEFLTSEYLVRAAPRPEPDLGLTSIIILTHNQLGYTRLCLDSIRRCTDEPYEVIVVDNASTDRTPEYLDSLGGVTLIRNETNRGFPAAANQGLRAARGRQALLLNNDTVVTTGWLRRMLRTLHSEPTVGLVGPCSNLVSGEQQIPVDYDGDLIGLDGFAWEWGKTNDCCKESTDRLVGFCLLIRREVMDKIGLLDERFGTGCFEDDDYSLRAVRAGYHVVIARDAFVHHFGGRTFVGAGVNYDALLRRNRELFHKKWQAGEEQAGGSVAPARPSTAVPPESPDPRILLIAHVDRLRGRMDKSHYYRYEALAGRPGVTLFGPGIEGYRPGMSVREAVTAACGGAWPDVIIHGGDLKESGVPLVTGLGEAPALTAVELLDSWTRENRQASFINRQRFAVGLIQEAGPHLEAYRARCPGTEFFWTPNAVDARLFHDWGLPKEYDVILYGVIDPHVYPLRSRLATLLAVQPGIRLRRICHPGYYPATQDGVISGANLSREINKSWIGLATRSVYNCLLMKYLEIAASHALVAGDMPEHARPLFGDNFIELRMEQSDEEILGTLRAHLADKDRLRAMTDAAHRRVLREHSTEAFADRILLLFRKLLAKRRAPASAAERPPAPAATQAAVHTAPLGPNSCFGVRVAAGGGLLLQRREVRLSLCMIVRDNARTIEACLTSIRPWVDEMCVVDTGSVDETPRMATRLGARIFHFPWCDSFSAARNESLRNARGRWVFWMDSDDVISPENGRKLRALADGDPGPSILGYVMQVHCPGPGPDGHLDVTVVDHIKLFRNLPHLRFDGRIHEQILPAIRRSGGETAWSDVFVVHSGYDHSPEGQEQKKQRDLKLLLLELEERPDHPFTLFNLGMTYADIGEYGRATEFLGRSIRRSGEGESHLRKAYALLVYCCGQLRLPNQAWETCERGLRQFPEDVELRFRRALLLHEAGRLQESAEGYLAILNGRAERYFASMDRAISGFKSRQNLALVYADMGDLARSEEQWRLIVREAPRHRTGWRGLGEVLLRRGQRDEAAALAERMRADDHLRADGLLLGGRVAADAGDAAEARRRHREAAARSDDASVVESCCQYLFENGEPAEAEAALKDLIRLRPEDAAAHHNLGAIYARQGRATAAAAAYRQSLELRPDSAPTWLRLGDAFQDAGRMSEAADAWSQALRLDPGNAEAAESLRRARQAVAP